MAILKCTTFQRLFDKPSQHTHITDFKHSKYTTRKLWFLDLNLDYFFIDLVNMFRWMDEIGVVIYYIRSSYRLCNGRDFAGNPLLLLAELSDMNFPKLNSALKIGEFESSSPMSGTGRRQQVFYFLTFCCCCCWLSS